MKIKPPRHKVRVEGYPCIVCKKVVTPDAWGDPPEYVDNGPASIFMDSGMLVQAVPPYGSHYDYPDRLLTFALCDDCMGDGFDEGVISEEFFQPLPKDWHQEFTEADLIPIEVGEE